MSHSHRAILPTLMIVVVVVAGPIAASVEAKSSSLCAAANAAELATVVPSLGVGQPAEVPPSGGLQHSQCEWKQSNGFGQVTLGRLTATTATTRSQLRYGLGGAPAAGSTIQRPAPGLAADSQIVTDKATGAFTVGWVHGDSLVTLDVRATLGKRPDKAKTLALAKLIYGRL